MRASIRLTTFVLCGCLTGAPVAAQLKDARLADYEQWRLAQKSGAVADPASIVTLPGFKIELIRVARPDEGWPGLDPDRK